MSYRYRRGQVVGMGAAEADQAVQPLLAGQRQVWRELEPLVAGDQRIGLVQAQQRQFDPSPLQPVEFETLQGCMR